MFIKGKFRGLKRHFFKRARGFAHLGQVDVWFWGGGIRSRSFWGSRGNSLVSTGFVGFVRLELQFFLFYGFLRSNILLRSFF
ncbi:hypothetical protein HBZS_123150 [Helicobacter bizzozeronii CCUG 35545]|nr:hypothetical protein HBZS_123150 [Helicobacter bizzozeronii CCUG 35545]